MTSAAKYAILTLLALSLTACGSGAATQNQPNTQTQPDTQSQTETTTQTNEPQNHPQTDQTQPQGESPDNQDKTQNKPAVILKTPGQYKPGEGPGRAALELAACEYSVWYDETNVVFNSEGERIRDADVHVSPLRDLLTGETTFFTATYKEYTRFETEDGFDYNTAQLSQLYDRDGRLLEDWTETGYYEGFGDWVISRKYIDYINAWTGEPQDDNSVMINYATGERREGVSYLVKVGDDRVAAEGAGFAYESILKADGTVTFSIRDAIDSLDHPAYACIQNDYVILCEELDSGKYKVYFYTPDGELLGVTPDVDDSAFYNEGVLAPYIVMGGDVYNPSEGNGGVLSPIYRDDTIAYFDGDRAISGKEVTPDSYEWNYRLYDAKTAVPLSEEYSIFTFAGSGGRTPTEAAPYFLATSGNGVVKLDRDGTVIARADISGINQISAYTDGIIAHCDDYENCCLMDTDLNTRIPAGTYRYLSPLWDDTGMTVQGLWQGTYYLNSWYGRTDVLAPDGTILIHGASNTGNLTGDRLPVTLGQSVGVMDLSGNWIFRCRKSDLENND